MCNFDFSKLCFRHSYVFLSYSYSSYTDNRPLPAQPGYSRSPFGKRRRPFSRHIGGLTWHSRRRCLQLPGRWRCHRGWAAGACNLHHTCLQHHGDVIMGTITSQITSLTTVYSTVYSGADQSKHQSSASLAFVRGIHRRPVNSPHKWLVTRKMFPFDDVIMTAMTCQYDTIKFRHNTSNVLQYGHFKHTLSLPWVLRGVYLWLKASSYHFCAEYDMTSYCVL